MTNAKVAEIRKVVDFAGVSNASVGFTEKTYRDLPPLASTSDRIQIALDHNSGFIKEEVVSS